MSAAALYAMDTGVTNGAVAVLFAGAKEPVSVYVTSLPDGAWRGAVEMPRPLFVGQERFSDGIERPVVRFDGITHVIVETPLAPEAAEALFEKTQHDAEARIAGYKKLAGK